MIYIDSAGRLGNQMFFYAFARAIQEKNPALGKITFIFHDYKFDKYGGLPILDFNVKDIGFTERPVLALNQRIVNKLFNKLIKYCNQKNANAVSKALTVKLQPILNLNGLYKGVGSDNARIHHISINKNIYATGYWESPIYFNSIKAKLRSEFTPKHDVLPHNIGLLNEIVTSNSVCVSIRRGDFLKKGYEQFNVCSEEYFYEAEKIIASTLHTYKLFIFSDDVEWCKQNMHFQGPVTFENNNGDDPVWEKMRLMSACKYFIISNSTFSWWAQYLSDYPEKIVIAPRPWRRNEYCDSLYDESFVLLDVSIGKAQQN